MRNFKGQVSFEYIVLFTILLIAFIVIGSVAGLGMDRINSFEKEGQRLAERIKVEVITASLSEKDFFSVVLLPKNIKGEIYTVEIHKDPDNIVMVKRDDKVVGKEYLPIISDVSNSPFSPNDNLKIEKTAGEIKISEGALT